MPDVAKHQYNPYPLECYQKVAIRNEHQQNPKKYYLFYLFNYHINIIILCSRTYSLKETRPSSRLNI